METPHFGVERQEQPERSARKEKMELADGVVATILQETFARVEQEMAEQKEVSLKGREYPIVDEYDRRLAREQLTTAHLEAQLAQARERNDHYLEKELAALVEFARLKENVTVHSAHIAQSYPRSAELLIPNDYDRNSS